MLKFGYISQIDVNTARVRVQFPDFGITSYWLPVLVQGSGKDKYFHTFDINEHVACVMEENMENGVCLGAVYDSSNQPSGGALLKTKVVFSDGGLVQYDAATSTLTAQSGTTSVVIKPTGVAITKAGESLRQILIDLITQMELETHLSAAPGSPTSPPVNVAAMTAIKARVTAFFAP